MAMTKNRVNRRYFLGYLSTLAGLVSSQTLRGEPVRPAAGKLQVSLAQWSLHRAIRSGLITNLDFPKVAREQFGIEGLEFVNLLWDAPTHRYVRQLQRNISETGTRALVLWVGGERPMGHSERSERKKAVQDHYKWVDIAAELGCHSIQANMESNWEPETEAEIETFVGHCVESFLELAEYAGPRNVNVLTENHSNTASMPEVLVRLMRRANRPNLGLLPDFGNFAPEIDKYESVRALMPFAKALSFKCYDFDSDGKETTIDMDVMMKIVLESGYSGWVGIEYEGKRLSEFEGIQAALRYLKRYV